MTCQTPTKSEKSTCPKNVPQRFGALGARAEMAEFNVPAKRRDLKGTLPPSWGTSSSPNVPQATRTPEPEQRQEQIGP